MSDYYATCVCGADVRVNMYGMGTCGECGRNRNPMAQTTPITDAASYKPPHGGFPGEDVVLDGARHEDDLPDLSDVFEAGKVRTGSFVGLPNGYPDWTDDRVYRLADEAEHFVELYRSLGRGATYEEARNQLQVIYDLVTEDGR